MDVHNRVAHSLALFTTVSVVAKVCEHVRLYHDLAGLQFYARALVRLFTESQGDLYSGAVFFSHTPRFGFITEFAAGGSGMYPASVRAAFDALTTALTGLAELRSYLNYRMRWLTPDELAWARRVSVTIFCYLKMHSEGLLCVFTSGGQDELFEYPFAMQRLTTVYNWLVGGAYRLLPRQDWMSEMANVCSNRLRY